VDSPDVWLRTACRISVSRQTISGSQPGRRRGGRRGCAVDADIREVAVEPSRRMIQQRSSLSSTVQASAEALPFPDGTFDAALAVLTLHHWTDWRRGLSEMRRGF